MIRGWITRCHRCGKEYQQQDPKRRSRFCKTCRRPTIEIFGEKKTKKEWSQDPRCVVSYVTFKNRLHQRHWEPERALTTPLQEKYRNG